MRRVSRRFLQLAMAVLLAGMAAVPSQAQDLSRLSCPLLAELRMGMLVRFGYCPPDRYYRQLYREFIPQCDSSLAEFQVESMILDAEATDAMTGETVEERDRELLQRVMDELRRKRCRF